MVENLAVESAGKTDPKKASHSVALMVEQKVELTVSSKGSTMAAKKAAHSVALMVVSLVELTVLTMVFA